ncbi:protein furry-like isoform X2 [Mizuhopecten yessoensis]|uniref:protein furry-like isoform X2 n=1 Tax=Mizuhopecten yessoensis TaxID=6573 RepID=UPI000B458703|nr:protein furry-like isoform X2 [Mizuhopecten yessoensis]
MENIEEKGTQESMEKKEGQDGREMLMIRFPWRRNNSCPGSRGGDDGTKPGEYILQTLFLEFCNMAEKKVEQVLAEPLEKPLSKSLQRGEDAQFDQLLNSFGCLAEQCLPSILRSLFRWFERQNLMDECSQPDTRQRHRSKGSKDFLCERRDLAVEFVYCLVLIEVLAKLGFHPGHNDLVTYIITQAFRHFKYKDGIQTNPNSGNISILTDLYSEVIGVLVQSRFTAVKKHFMSELRELKIRDQTPYTAQSIISLLTSLKYFKVKMHPIEDFEACVMFLQDLGHYFLEVKDRDIKHAVATLFVDILLPVAATAKNEVNVPVLKNLVDMLYTPALDLTMKKKHMFHCFPLVTCLLCVSQKTFFLNNWPYFLTTHCLSQLKNKDQKLSRMALDSLHRLLWVYMVRIKCESNTITHSRLQSIVSSLFPRGSKVVTPRDVPLNFFVKIIQFIAKEKQDFAMKEIIFDLLCVGRSAKILTPERMSIGLRAFLVIADSLQQKDGDPPMPQTQATLPSGATVRVKRTFLNKKLTDQMAKTIGLAQYYPHMLKAFDSMLHALDLQVGRQHLLTKSENVNKEPDDLMIGERKAKIELFRTCIAAIPRLIPDGMSCQELVELLTRLTVHLDEELKGHAFQALQNLMQESPQWREHVVKGFVQFVQRDISDTNTQLLDGALRLLMQLLVQWKTNIVTAQQRERSTGDSAAPMQTLPEATNILVLREVEGLSLVMLCSCRVVTRKLAALLLKEVRNIFTCCQAQMPEPCLLEMIDKACPDVVKRLLPSLPASEKPVLLTSPNIDLAWVIDRAASVWNPVTKENNIEERSESVFSKVDPWMRCIAMFVSSEYGMIICPHAVAASWPIVYTRLVSMHTLLDPNNMINEFRTSSILRSGTSSKKPTTEKDVHMQLWQNYVILACSVAQKDSLNSYRCASPEQGSSPESEKSDSRQASTSCTDLFKLIVPLMKCENPDMRDTIVNGLGYTNAAAFRDLIDELLPFLKEAIERKQETKNRRRKKDTLRVQLAHIFELMAENRTFAQSESGVIDTGSSCLIKTFVEYIDGARQYLESESDRDLPVLHDIRLHFSRFVRELIAHTPAEFKRSLLTRDLRYSLFHLFASWSGKFSHTIGDTLDRRFNKDESCSELELSAVRAMSAVLCCGPVFDPSGLNDDGYIYQWLDMLLSSHNDRIKEQIYELAKETVVLLLDFNPDTQGLLDWVIDRCYTGANEVADGCFNALAAVFQTREYPCDHVAMLNLAVLNVGSPRTQTHETAVHLLHLLDTRFFQETPVFTDSADDQRQQSLPLNDILMSVSYCHSQMYLSEQLARVQPDLTMPMFSEIAQRFQTAKPAVRLMLLKYLLPWLHNMELIDPSLPQSSPLNNFLTRLHDTQTDIFKPPLKGEGWGSPEATKMVLNNLFHLTVKFGDDHPKEVEDLWSSLVICWPNNLKVVIHYLVIITNMAASELLQYAKRVVSYLGRAKPERLVDELMNELQTVETLNMSIERTQTPPFFRLSQIKKSLLHINTTDDEKVATHFSDHPLEKGTLHTKRHSANDDLPSESSPRTDSTPSLRSSSSTSSNPDQFLMDEDLHMPTSGRGCETRRSESPMPYPLPMPAYGGYFAPLTEYLPENLHPTAGFHRSNIAVMFLSDLVLDGLEIDWSAHLPLMLHVIFLGLDHMRGMVYEHCKKLLENLMLLAAAQEHEGVARVLLEYRSNITDTLRLIAADDKDMPNTLEGHGQENESVGRSTFSLDSGQAVITPDVSAPIEQPADPDSLNTVEEVVKAILDFMDAKRGRPLWSCEDITPRTLNTQSAVRLEYFLKCVVKCFKEMQPLALVEQRWSQVALQLALSCSSRHYAGRSFQVLRALHIRPSTQMLSDILSRLVETVAEQGEDMQGYVTEIILTLEAAVDNLDLEFRPMDFMRELFISTPNLAKDGGSEGRKSCALMAPRHPSPHHARSTSYSQGPVHRTAPHLRLRSGTEVENRMRANMPRSRSAHSLKNLDHNGAEDKLTIMSQMFWIAVSLLESDFEYEFSLCVRLLSKILTNIQPERPECRERLEKIQQQIKWTNFPGIQTLLLKGFTSGALSELTWSLLSRLTVCIAAPVVDPTENLGFPINVVALLPLLVQNYENPSQSCRDAADHIAQVCSQRSDRLNNLGTIMSLYSRGTFGKDSFQWTKCVIKYLLDVYLPASYSLISFLVEVLEKGPGTNQLSVFQILHCMVHYMDINTTPASSLNPELFHTISRHVQGFHWREALKILKLAVGRSSTLTAAPPSAHTSEVGTFMSHTSFAEAEVITRKELPGRTLDFAVDFSEVGIIGRKYLNTEIHGSLDGIPEVQSSPARKGNQDHDSVWKKPQNSQTRVRERLAELLTCYGQKRLPKSPSDTFINKVIFSQSSDTLDHQHSVASSGEETSIPDNAASDILLSEPNVNDINMTIKGFDFLDNELEDSEENDFYPSLDRRHSYNLNSPEIERERHHHFGSVPDLKLIGHLSIAEKPVTPSDSISLKEERISDNESENMTPEEDGVSQNLPMGTTITIQNPMLDERRRSSPLTTSSTHSLHSTNSELDLVDLSSSTASPSFSGLQSVYLYLTMQSDEVEEAWKSHMGRIMSGSSATLMLNTTQIFPRLYKELRRRLDTMTKESSYYIAKTESLKQIATYFRQLLDTMFIHIDCPYFFTDSDTLSGSRVADRHKFNVLEMQECFETYCMRKDQAEQSLESIKSSIKQQSLGDGGNSVVGCSEEQKLDLCRKLYRLIFQLVQLFENYIKLMEVFTSVRASPQVVDISSQVSSLREEITQALSEMENGQDSPVNIDSGKVLTKQEALSSLAEYVNGQQYMKAIQLLRSFRSLWPNDMFGQATEDDVIVLLNIFCTSQAEKRTGIFALIGLDVDLSHVHSQLMTISVQMSGWSLLPLGVSKSTPDLSHISLTSDSSTL